jgi:hypothetical protein
MIKKLRYFIYLMLIFQTVQAQQPKRPEINLERFIEQRVGIITDDFNYEDLYENLFLLYQNPLDINKLGAEDLHSLHLLSNDQIKDFLMYRAENGPFTSLYELQVIPSFNRAVIDAILPFVTLEKRFEVGELKPTDMFFIMRADQVFEDQKGYSEPEIFQGKPTQRYVGSKQRVYSRFRMSTARNFSLGFTAEKDAGEQGIDFLSFHGQLQNRGKWKNIVLGDYQVQIGQGLLATAGFALGKGSEAINTVSRGNVGVRPYTSSLEAGFMRGASGTFVHKNFEITPFISINKVDGSGGNPDNDEDREVSSLLDNGYHRTENERFKKNRVTQQDYGLNVVMKHTNGQIGLAGMLTQLDKTLVRKPTYYNEFDFNGSQNHLISLHFVQLLSNVRLSGEVARSKSGGLGAVLSATKPISKRADLALLLRNYDKDFHTFYGLGFGENSRSINEQGAYLGFKYYVHKKLTFNTFIDFFKFPSPKYAVAEPSNGNDFTARLTYTPKRTTALTAQYFFENKERNLPNTKPAEVVATDRSTAFLNFDHAFNKKFSVQSRLQRNDFKYAGEDRSVGYMALQDVAYETPNWRVNARVAYFDTDSYDSRIYAYERDVLYAVSFPAYYRKGVRTYLNLRYDVARNMSFYCRLARTQLIGDYESIGSGLDEIEGNRRTDIKIQLVWRN